MFWLLTLGLPTACIVGLFFASPAIFWAAWEWLIGTPIGRGILLTIVILYTLLISYHIVFERGVQWQLEKDKHSLEVANAAVKKADLVNTHTSQAITAGVAKEATIAREQAATTNQAAIVKIRTLTRVIRVPIDCTPVAPAEVEAISAINAEGQAAVERARSAGK